MRAGHGANSIFFNKRNKDCTSRLHALPPPSPTSHTHTYTHTPSLKVDVICVSPLIKCIKAYVVVEILTLVKQFKILNNTSLLTINQDQPNMLLIIRDTPSWRVMKNTPSREVIYFLVIKIAGHEKT